MSIFRRLQFNFLRQSTAVSVLLGRGAGSGAGDFQEITLGTGLSMSGTTLSATGGIGGSTGTVDNALLRADGTGGSTAQASDISIDDAATTTQNNVTINVDHAGQTNSYLGLRPKGNGGLFLGPKPDGTTTGGNARGQYAVDLQIIRSAANMVASANYSAILGGQDNRVNSPWSAAVGQTNTVLGTSGWNFVSGVGNTINTSGYASFISGESNTSNTDVTFTAGSAITNNGQYSAAVGRQHTIASGTAYMFASGRWTNGTLVGSRLHAPSRFSATGDAQRSDFQLMRAITGTAATGLSLDGTAPGVGTRAVLPATNRVWAFHIHLVAVCATSGGSINDNDVFSGIYEGVIKRVGTTTSLVGGISTVNTWSDGGFVGNVPTVAITADDTNEALDIQWTTNGGSGATVVRVNARIDLIEIGW